MDESQIVTLLVGGLLSLGGVWLQNHLSTRREERRQRREDLKELLGKMEAGFSAYREAMSNRGLTEADVRALREKVIVFPKLTWPIMAFLRKEIRLKEELMTMEPKEALTKNVAEQLKNTQELEAIFDALEAAVNQVRAELGIPDYDHSELLKTARAEVASKWEASRQRAADTGQK